MAQFLWDTWYGGNGEKTDFKINFNKVVHGHGESCTKVASARKHYTFGFWMRQSAKAKRLRSSTMLGPRVSIVMHGCLRIRRRMGPHLNLMRTALLSHHALYSLWHWFRTNLNRARKYQPPPF